VLEYGGRRLAYFRVENSIVSPIPRVPNPSPLLAQNNAFNPVYESLFAAGILILSLVMLKGVFPRWVAYLGIATFPACIAAMSLWPLVGLNYFWWWAFFTVWFVAVGLKLLRLGREAAISRK